VRYYGLFLWVIIAIAHWPEANSATIVGSVIADKDSPLRGALVTLTSADGLHSETVFTAQDGSFRIDTKLLGTLTLRARRPLMRDVMRQLNVPSATARIASTLKLEPLTRAQDTSDTLPASAHFARIRFSNELTRRQFQTDCLSCHQLGNPFTRAPRSAEQWKAIVTLMLTYAGYSSRTHLQEYADALQRAFDGTPTKATERTEMSDRALKARILEWKLPGASIAHDSEFSPADGNYYTVDQGIDSLYVLNPKTDTRVTIPLPDGGVPVGGRFAERGLPIPFGLTVRHGVHSLQFGPEGQLYMTGSIGGEIGVFDISSRNYTAHRIPGTALYPHTLRFDRSGIAWFTIAQSNQIGRFDPRTHESKVIDLPRSMSHPDERQPLPYGIDVNPNDGSIWYSKLWAGKIGRIDPKSLQVTEYEPPMFGPRRLRFDARGLLWIPGFGDGTITRLDPSTMSYKSYPIPTLGGGEVEAPYAVAVNPDTQDVWITANMSDRVFRFIPGTETFVVYPLPTRGTYFRDFFFPAKGRVCAPSSPMPPRPEVIEGGMDMIVCLETND